MGTFLWQRYCLADSRNGIQFPLGLQDTKQSLLPNTAHQLRLLGDIRRDPPRFILAEPLIGDPSFQDTIKRASNTTARIRSSKKAAKITVSRMVPQSDLVSDALSPRATPSPIAPIFLCLALHRWRFRIFDLEIPGGSGSLTILAAILRASSLLGNLASSAERRLILETNVPCEGMGSRVRNAGAGIVRLIIRHPNIL